MSGALVLAGGGVAGIAWEVGVLFGIEETEPAALARIMRLDSTFIGTSAGSVVASQIAGGVSLRELYDQQFVEESSAVGAIFDAEKLRQTIAALLEGAASALDGRQRVGRFALEAQTMTAAERREVLFDRIAVHEWPQRKLLVTAVDAVTGQLRVFDRACGVELLDAVGASCAVPGIWPTVEIEGRQYIDGGVCSIANADLAVGSDPVLILAPLAEALGETAITPQELSVLQPARVRVMYADAPAIAAFGNNSLDTATSAASALAGFEQGRRSAPEIAAFWS